MRSCAYAHMIPAADRVEARARISQTLSAVKCQTALILMTFGTGYNDCPVYNSSIPEQQRVGAHERIEKKNGNKDGHVPRQRDAGNVPLAQGRSEKPGKVRDNRGHVRGHKGRQALHRDKERHKGRGGQRGDGHRCRCGHPDTPRRSAWTKARCRSNRKRGQGGSRGPARRQVRPKKQVPNGLKKGAVWHYTMDTTFKKVVYGGWYPVHYCSVHCIVPFVTKE